ncbi:MAG: tetratricopeptide repeat protein [Acidobacteriota bacterium]|nr:tetratricopeptide repeat protein [Acidobacteriota bacterium]
MSQLRLGMLVGCTVAVLFAALVVVRNYRFEAGARALKTGDYATTLRELKPLARLGDRPSQYILGEMYAFGFGVRKDDSEAVYWFKRAAILAQKGVDPAAPAEFSVSKAYAEGTGVKVDVTESLKWLQLAAAGGSKEAVAKLAETRSH